MSLPFLFFSSSNRRRIERRCARRAPTSRARPARMTEGNNNARKKKHEKTNVGMRERRRGARDSAVQAFDLTHTQILRDSCFSQTSCATKRYRTNTGKERKNGARRWKIQFEDVWDLRSSSSSPTRLQIPLLGECYGCWYRRTRHISASTRRHHPQDRLSTREIMNPSSASALRC